MKIIINDKKNMKRKRYIMEYLERGGMQQVIMAANIKEARKMAARLAELRGIKEYYVYAV
jgi:UDP-3-O-[3-hydroxymyristoyl] glucosamine N-acyltransferase